MSFSSLNGTVNGVSTRHGLEDHYHQAINTQDYIRRYFGYLSSILNKLDTTMIEKIIALLDQAAQQGSMIYLIGNGGSAATASHIANDLSVGAWVPDLPPFRVVSLTDNVPVMTAISNDVHYDCLFTHQLRALLQPNDILIALSVSGNSANINEAVRLAHRRGTTTIGVCGFDGGELRDLADVCLHVPSYRGEYGPVEDVMMILDHLIHSYFMLSRCGTLRRNRLAPMMASA